MVSLIGIQHAYPCNIQDVLTILTEVVSIMKNIKIILTYHKSKIKNLISENKIS